MNRKLKKTIKEISVGEVKYINPKKVKSENIDTKLKSAIININKSNWCYTLWSCQGHQYEKSHSVPYITFLVKNKHIGIFFDLIQTTLMPYGNKSYPILGNGQLLIDKGYGNNTFTTFSVYWSEHYLKNKKFRKYMFRSLNYVSRKIRSFDGK